MVLLALSLFVYFLKFVCGQCDKYPELLEEIVCVNETNNEDCSWFEKSLGYEMHQEKNTFNVKIPTLSTCNSNNLTIMLYVNTLSSTKCYPHTRWKRHSEIMFIPNSKCDEYRIPSFTFNYIFTGCYKVIVHNPDEGRDVSESDPIFIQSNYTKASLVENIVLLPLVVREGVLEVVLKIGSDHNTVKPPSISTVLGEVTNDFRNLRGVINIEFSKTESESYISHFTICDSFKNAQFNCVFKKDYYKHMVYICTYKGLHHGDYIFQYKLLNEYTRCNKGTLWARPGHSCDGKLYISVPQTTSIVPLITADSSESLSTEMTIITSIIVLILLVILCLTVHKRFCKKKTIQDSAKTSYNFLSLENRDLSLDIPQEILLVYTRESQSFCKIILSFKNILFEAGNIKVYDINDCNEEMNIDPQEWITTKVSDPNTIIILYLNVCSLMILKKFSQITYKDEQYQDKLFIFTLKQLRTVTNRNEQNLFVLQPNNIPKNSFFHASLPTERNYIMPFDIYGLLNSFLSSDVKLSEDVLKMFKDCCSSYDTLTRDPIKYINNTFFS